MNSLKTKLSYKILFISFIVVIYSYYLTTLEFFSYYDSNTKEIVGTVTEIDYQDGYKLVIKNQEKFLGYYYKEVDIKLGDQVKISGNLEVPNKNTNFNLFNYQKYLLSKNIHYIVKIDNLEVIKNGNLFYQVKNKIIERINNIPLSKNYLNTFILGNNSIDDNINESYRKNGISHLLSISGMHITFLGFLILKVLNKFKHKCFITDLILLFYALLTGFKVPVIRACMLFVLMNLKGNKINYILILGCILLLINPYYLYDLGFKFSFIISIYLILFNYLSVNKNYLTKLLITSFIAFLASFPILINNFYEINLLTPLINIIFIPFVSFILFPFTFLTFVFPFLDNTCYFLITILEKLSLVMSNVNFNLTFMKASFLLIILYYFLITLSLFNKKYFVYLTLLLIVHLLLPVFNFSYKINIIDVSQGDSSLIRFPNNKLNILIDTGGIVNKEDYISKNILNPYLKSLGITKLDYLILSHGDYDHMGESINLVNNFKVENVIFNCGSYNDLEKELIKVLEKKNINYYSCIKELNIDKYKLIFLNTREYDNENDNSNVIYFNYDNYKFLFMGDAGFLKEKDILDKYSLKNIDFLKVGHHGSNTSSSEEFINSINPKYSLISVGKNNRYGHPKDEVLDTLKNSKIYRTDLDGSIEIKLNKNGYKIRTCPP